MKKLYMVLLCLVAAVTSISAKQVWFDNSSTNWGKPAVYYWGGSQGLNDWGQAKEMTKDGDTNIYGYNVPDDISGMKFRDLNGKGESSGDITNIVENGLWKGSSTSNDGTHQGGGQQGTVTPPAENQTGAIRGEEFGWDPGKAMTYDEATKKFTVEVTLTAGKKFKLYCNGGWVENMNIAENSKDLIGAAGNDYTAKETLENVKLIYDPSTKTLEVEQAARAAKIYLQNSDNWSDMTPADWEMKSEDGVVYTLSKATVKGGFEFLMKVDGESNILGSVEGTLKNYITKSNKNLKFAEGKYTGVEFIYSTETKKLTVNGTKKIVTVPVYFANNTNEYGDTDEWLLTSEDGVNYVLKVASVSNNLEGKIHIPSLGDNGWIQVSGVTGTLASFVNGAYGDSKNVRFNDGEYTDVVFTYNYETKALNVDGKKAGADKIEGKYAFGNQIYLVYRNDADATAEFKKEEIKFDAWNAETNPYGLELFVYTFRADAREIPFYLENDANIVLDNAQTMELNSFYNYVYMGENTETQWNKFTGLTLGEEYRVIVKAFGDSETGTSYIGIFPVNSEYPWGDLNGLRLHSNLENGSWPGTGESGVNISQGPLMEYNPNTKVWYYDFTAGAPGALNHHKPDMGWEFTFTDIYGIQWYKADTELKKGDWQEGGMTVQTADNDYNYYINSSEMEEGKEYRLQLRKNPSTGNWEMRLTEKPNFSGSIYIVGKDTPAGWIPANAVEMEKATDVNGDVIEGVYIYTMPYTTGDGEGFKLSTAKGSWDVFNANLITRNDCMGEGIVSQVEEIGKPYASFYGGLNNHENNKAGNWMVSGNPGFITVAVNYNTGDVTVYSPSIEIAFENRHVSKMAGRFDAEAMGVPAEQVTNKVEGSSKAHPVVFDRMNHITADINVTHRFFDSECTLTITGARINGLDIEGMEGVTDAEALKNSIENIPYAGHLILDDGQEVNATYEVEVDYTIAKGDASKKGTAAISYEPNFQPYFVRPRPVTDDGQSLRVRIGVNNDDYKAFAMRTVKFSGNVFDYDGAPVYHDYLGGGNLDEAKVAVYPGFLVEGAHIEAPAAGEHHVPAGSKWNGVVGDFFLADYTEGGAADWSSVALLAGKLPVFVNTNCTALEQTPEFNYHVYAHYPVYSVGGGQRVSAVSTMAAGRVAGEARVDNVIRERVHNVAERDAATTGVENVAVDFGAEGEAEYFDLQGIRIANPVAGRIYIVRQNGKVSKIRF